MTPNAGSPRLWIWGSAGIFLVLGLAAYWFFDTQVWEVDSSRLRRLRDAALVDSTSALALSNDWPQWRGLGRDGIAPAFELLTGWPAGGPPLLWKAESGLGLSSLAVAAGRVFTLVQEGDAEAAACWDADTGRELWRFRYPCQRLDLPFGDGPRATPAADDDRVYFLGAAGALHCLNAADGKKLWHHELADEFPNPLVIKGTIWGYAGSPLVERDRIFTLTNGAANNAIAAFDKRTGQLAWKAHDDPLSSSSPIAVTIDGARQIVFFTGRGLVGLAPEDGTVLWRFPWKTNDNCNIATPIASGNYLFLSSGYDRGCALLEINRDRGVWLANVVYAHKRMRNHFASCVLHQEHLYGFDNAMLVCMEFRTGRVTWKQRGFGKGSLLATGNHLLILGEQGKLVLAAAAPDRYREQASFQVSSGRTWALPALAGGRLYVRDLECIRCFDLRKR